MQVDRQVGHRDQVCLECRWTYKWRDSCGWVASTYISEERLTCVIHFGSTSPSSAAKYVRSMPRAFVARMDTTYLYVGMGVGDV